MIMKMDNENELKEALAECERLRKENAKLKALLSAFSLKTGSSLLPPNTETSNTDKKNKQEAVSSGLSSEEKISLFRSLFRGRLDVFALRWESKKARSGYSPACANEWNEALCRKPCAKCKNASYLPVTDEVIRRHLGGKHTVGIYPLRPDEACFFLAVDFDKGEWEKDVRAFVTSCRKMEIPAGVERSRSGKGGHVWIFFKEAISASLARNLGGLILTDAMEGRHQIGFDSYDRFFPSQDTMPKGGFGNLIALPLQGIPRQQDNSVFVDRDFAPYADQWKFLKSIERLDKKKVEQIVSKGQKEETLFGIRWASQDEEKPWTLPPSGRRPELPLKEPFPKRVDFVLADRLYVSKAGLSSQLTHRIEKLAAFHNPEFYKAQRMRMSTFCKPRIISCSEDLPKYLALPRGCLSDLRSFGEQHGIAFDIRDERYPGKEFPVTFQGILRDEQQSVVNDLMEHDNGLLVAPTGFGKTTMAAWIITQRKVNTLVLVHRKLLMEQWREQLALFLGLKEKDIGLVGGGRKKRTGLLDVALIQSLQRKGEVANLVAEYGQIIVDECHHIPAFSMERVVRKAKAKYVLGLTATPIRRDGHHPIIFMQCGPVRAKVGSKRATDQRPFSHHVIFRNTGFILSQDTEEPTIQEIYGLLVHDEARNQLIIDDIKRAVAQGRVPLVLSERTEHVDLIAKELQHSIHNVIVLKGGMGKRKRSDTMQRPKEISDNEERVIVATGRYAGEGFDDARLDTLFLTLPVSWRGVLQQYVGRLHRLHRAKQEVRVYDYVDDHVPMLLRMYQKRLAGYRALGYQVDGQRTLL